MGPAGVAGATVKNLTLKGDMGRGKFLSQRARAPIQSERQAEATPAGPTSLVPREADRIEDAGNGELV